MSLPKILAHGALGPWDEIIFLSVFAIFIVIMGISWVRSRAVGDADLEDEGLDAPNDDGADEAEDRFALK